MFPLRDNIPSHSTAVVNYGLIGITAAVFLMQVSEPDGQQRLVEQFAMIPARVSHPDRSIKIPSAKVEHLPDGQVRQVMEEKILPPSAFPVWLTIFTCIFLHGGLMHFAGNIWFLYIFGDNVEDRFGHIGYLVFYLASGVAASLTHYITEPNSVIPTIGASGAIAGVMGAYFLMYPKSQVLALIPIFYIIRIIVVPAPVFLGIWFAIQFFQGTAALSGAGAGGVAWWAHIGGFLAGLCVAWICKMAGLLRPAANYVRYSSDSEIRHPYSRRQSPW